MLNIATINIQNKYKLKKYDGLYEKEDHIEMLLDLIEKYHLDIIGLQEVNPRYEKRLKEKMKPPFTYHGTSRYHKNILTNHIEPFHTFNESTPIITKQKVLKEKTKHLPWISSLVPRIVTILEVQTKELGPIIILNTHLDNRKSTTKKKELDYLYKMIEMMKKPIILMGDFNMTVKNTDFQEFIEKMKVLSISHIDISEKTFKKAKTNYAIDHVFLSNVFQVESIILEKSKEYAHFSDHYPIILKLNLGFYQK